MARTDTYSYTTDADQVYNIRLSPASAGATGQGAIDTTRTDDNIFVSASSPGSRRKKGLQARGVRLFRTVGTAPNSFKLRSFLPITTQAALAAIALNTTITLNGQAWTVGAKVNEG